jgi:tRNA threonylcarbamoyladenosine biosynthesis protein TsaB
MITLGLDTCLAACSVAVIEDDRVLAAASEPMVRGHQERLASMAGEVLRAAGLDFAGLDRIGVTVGPGSFTGLRVGLAFAKGLGLALDRPCVAVGSLEALAAGVTDAGVRAAVIDAGRGRVFLEVFEREMSITAADSLELATAAARLAELAPSAELTLIGPGVKLIAGVVRRARIIEQAAPAPEVVAKLAARRAAAPPRPLYLRAPDAKPKAA